jgi:hypothetical protein
MQDYMRSVEALRLGRCSNSPPQFGQSRFICAEHPAQNVGFIRADVCFVIDPQRPTTFFARNPHFERHAAPCPRCAFQVNWVA